ncbi:MAG: dienelactone hydrolase family protein, partial [Acidimicrobiia bacterium]
ITVIAIDEFFRMANEDKKLDEISREEKLSRMSELNDIEECADIIACAQLLRQQHGCTTVGLIGFCIGGMYAFKCAGSGVFDSVVSCYGMITMPNDWAQQGQKDAIDYLQNDACSKVLAIVGGEDFGFAKDDDVDLLRITLSNEHHKNIGSRLEIFNEAGHAFMHDPNREEYRSDDAKAAWKFAFDFLFENKV